MVAVLSFLILKFWLGACLTHSAGHGDCGSAEDVGNLRVAQARGVVFERQMLFGFIEAETAQAVGVGEFAEQAELFRGKRGLQFVSDFHECHVRHYSSPLQAERGSPPAALDTR
jgi:hypothetical protein